MSAILPDTTLAEQRDLELRYDTLPGHLVPRPAYTKATEADLLQGDVERAEQALIEAVQKRDDWKGGPALLLDAAEREVAECRRRLERTQARLAAAE
jgi:hypothetical protein